MIKLQNCRHKSALCRHKAEYSCLQHRRSGQQAGSSTSSTALAGKVSSNDVEKRHGPVRALLLSSHPAQYRAACQSPHQQGDDFVQADVLAALHVGKFPIFLTDTPVWPSLQPVPAHTPASSCTLLLSGPVSWICQEAPASACYIDQLHACKRPLAANRNAGRQGSNPVLSPAHSLLSNRG